MRGVKATYDKPAFRHAVTEALALLQWRPADLCRASGISSGTLSHALGERLDEYSTVSERNRREIVLALVLEAERRAVAIDARGLREVAELDIDFARSSNRATDFTESKVVNLRSETLINLAESNVRDSVRKELAPLLFKLSKQSARAGEIPTALQGIAAAVRLVGKPSTPDQRRLLARLFEEEASLLIESREVGQLFPRIAILTDAIEELLPNDRDVRELVMSLRGHGYKVDRRPNKAIAYLEDLTPKNDSIWLRRTKGLAVSYGQVGDISNLTKLLRSSGHRLEHLSDANAASGYEAFAAALGIAGAASGARQLLDAAEIALNQVIEVKSIAPRLSLAFDRTAVVMASRHQLDMDATELVKRATGVRERALRQSAPRMIQEVEPILDRLAS